MEDRVPERVTEGELGREGPEEQERAESLEREREQDDVAHHAKRIHPRRRRDGRGHRCGDRLRPHRQAPAKPEDQE
jgi:hypothetical protein